MDIKRRGALLCSLLLLALGIVAVSTPAALAGGAATRTLTLSIPAGPNSLFADAGHRFGELVARGTNRRLQVRVYPDLELSSGDQVGALRMAGAGAIDVTIDSTLTYGSLDARFLAVSLPWLFSDLQHVDTALAGDLARDYLALTGDHGIVGLALGENGFRQLTNDRRAVRSPADLEGLRVRIPPAALYDSIFQQLGAVPVTLPFPRVAAALSTGSIDGQENPLAIIAAERLDRLQSHLTIWNYSYDPLILGDQSGHMDEPRTKRSGGRARGGAASDSGEQAGDARRGHWRPGGVAPRGHAGGRTDRRRDRRLSRSG